MTRGKTVPQSARLGTGRYRSGFPVLLVLGALAATGVALTACGRTGPPAATATATQISLPTQVVVIPTTTARPTGKPSAEPSATASPTRLVATQTPNVTATRALTPTQDASLLTADVPANVRSGPGLVYPVIGSLPQGGTAEAIGRDSSSTWFVIAFEGARQGQGWISSLVASFPGEIASLPLVAAPPPPPATATPRPVANPNPGPVAGTRGVSGQLTLCSPKTTYAVGERVCFVEWIKNNTAEPIGYGILGVQATNLAGGGQFQTSWSGELVPGGLLGIDPGCLGPTDRCNGQWEDGVILRTPGTYRLTLQLCYSDFGTCLGNDGVWEVLSAAITIAVV
jgi:Bacterial SH3 domain